MDKATSARWMDWKTIGLTGLIVGTISLLVTGGSPWDFAAFVRPMVMGREIAIHAPRGGGTNLYFIVLHYALSVAFVFVMAPILSRIQIGKAILAAGLFGVLFYAVNRLVFFLLTLETIGGESRPLLTSVCFCLLAASVYRGMVRGSTRVEL